jgi:hypothetical protein
MTANPNFKESRPVLIPKLRDAGLPEKEAIPLKI